jgi:hypothetical protein
VVPAIISTPNVISFNNILRAENIDPATVRLIRHQEGRRRGQIIFATSRMPDGRAKVEEYQRTQHRSTAECNPMARYVYGVQNDGATGVCDEYPFHSAAQNT